MEGVAGEGRGTTPREVLLGFVWHQEPSDLFRFCTECWQMAEVARLNVCRRLIKDCSCSTECFLWVRGWVGMFVHVL